MVETKVKPDVGGGAWYPNLAGRYQVQVHEGFDHGLGDFRVFPDPCMSCCVQLEMNYFSVHRMINERKTIRDD